MQQVAASSKILAPSADTSTVELLPLCPKTLQSFEPQWYVRSLRAIMINLRNVKREALDPIIELFSESKKKTPS
jgi:hypothetical protein